MSKHTFALLLLLLVLSFALTRPAPGQPPKKNEEKEDRTEQVTLQYRIKRDGFAPSKFVAVGKRGITPPAKIQWDIAAAQKKQFDSLIADLEEKQINRVEFICKGEWLDRAFGLRVTTVPELTEAGKKRISEHASGQAQRNAEDDRLEVVTLLYRIAGEAMFSSRFVAVGENTLHGAEIQWDIPPDKKKELDALAADLEEKQINRVDFTCKGEWLKEGSELRVATVPELTDAGKRRIREDAQERKTNKEARLEPVTLQYRVKRDGFASSKFVAVGEKGVTSPLKIQWDIPPDKKKGFDSLIADLEEKQINRVEFTCSGKWLRVKKATELRVTTVPELTEAGKKRIRDHAAGQPQKNAEDDRLEVVTLQYRIARDAAYPSRFVALGYMWLRGGLRIQWDIPPNKKELDALIADLEKKQINGAEFTCKGEWLNGGGLRIATVPELTEAGKKCIADHDR